MKKQYEKPKVDWLSFRITERLMLDGSGSDVDLGGGLIVSGTGSGLIPATGNENGLNDKSSYQFFDE